MQGLIDGIFFSVTTLFLIRLYTTNDSFYRSVNRLFYQIQSIHYWFIKKSKLSRKWQVGIFFSIIIFAILTFYILAKDILHGVLMLLLIFVPALYIYSQQVKAIQADPVDQMIDRINQGLVSKKDLERLRHTIKHFYTLIYAPQQRDTKPPNLLIKIIAAILLLLRPRVWSRLIVPFITKHKSFASLFYYSPFHHRQKPYFDVYDTIRQLTAVHLIFLQGLFVNDINCLLEVLQLRIGFNFLRRF